MFDWSDLRYFLSVGRTGSFNAAARELSISQPTVSRRINGFEEKVGAPVFNRLPEGVSLTETGMALWEKALAVEAAALIFEGQLGADKNGMNGSVRIAATEGLGALWLTPRLSAFSHRHPSISLELLLDNRAADLLRREADIALRLSRPVTPELICKKIGQLSFGLFASLEYVEAHGLPVDLSNLRGHKLVTLSLRHSMLDEIWQDVQDGDTPVPFRTNSSLAEIAAVRAGFGIGLIPAYVGRLFRLTPVLPETTWRRRDIWLVVHPDVRRTTKVRIVTDEIIDIFKAESTDLSQA